MFERERQRFDFIPAVVKKEFPPGQARLDVKRGPIGGEELSHRMSQLAKQLWFGRTGRSTFRMDLILSFRRGIAWFFFRATAGQAKDSASGEPEDSPLVECDCATAGGVPFITRPGRTPQTAVGITLTPNGSELFAIKIEGAESALMD